MKIEVIETPLEVEVKAEPYGSATLNLESQMLSVDFVDEVPWSTFVKMFKEIKRAVSRNNKQRLDFIDSD